MKSMGKWRQKLVLGMTAFFCVAGLVMAGISACSKSTAAPVTTSTVELPTNVSVDL